jgi:hypothetical protein
MPGEGGIGYDRRLGLPSGRGIRRAAVIDRACSGFYVFSRKRHVVHRMECPASFFFF